jgi:hypothetical protein
MKQTLPLLGVVLLGVCLLLVVELLDLHWAPGAFGPTGTAAAQSFEEDEDLPMYRGKPVKQWILDLRHPEDTTGRQAKRNLDEMGPADKDVVPALIAAVGDGEKFVQVQALNLLGQIGPNAKKALSAVDKAIMAKDREVSQAAIRAEIRINSRK